MMSVRGSSGAFRSRAIRAFSSAHTKIGTVRLALRPVSAPAAGGARGRVRLNHAIRLREQDELVAGLPRGVKGEGKDFQGTATACRASGRGGLVADRLRTGWHRSWPRRHVGSAARRFYPKDRRSSRSGSARALTGRLLFPITPDFPLLGPLAPFPLPSNGGIESSARPGYRPLPVRPRPPADDRPRSSFGGLRARLRRHYPGGSSTTNHREKTAGRGGGGGAFVFVGSGHRWGFQVRGRSFR